MADAPARAKGKFSIKEAPKEDFPMHGQDREIASWLVRSVRIISTVTAMFGRAAVKLNDIDKATERVRDLLGHARSRPIRKSSVSWELCINTGAIDELERLSKVFGIELKGTRFWSSLCRAKSATAVKKQCIAEEFQRLKRLKVREGEEPKCEKCGATTDLFFTRPEERKEGSCVSTLLMSRKRWPEAEALARESTLMCNSCSGKKPKRAHNE